MSQKMLRQRKMLLVLPLLIVPFVSIAFWALGGGRSNGTGNDMNDTSPGLNLDLPGAQFKGEKELNKLGYYEKAANDSSKLLSAKKSDPYYHEPLAFPDDSVSMFAEGFENTFPATTTYSPAQQERQVYQKLAALQQAMEQTETVSPSRRYQPDYQLPISSPQVDRLEQLLQQPTKSSAEADPELDQLNVMLDKIKDIQHPESVKQKSDAIAVPHEVAPLLISTTPEKDTIADGFYPINYNTVHSINSSGILAVIHEGQTVMNGSVVRIRLLQDLFIGTVRIPAGIFLSGTVSIQQERLQLSIQYVRYANDLFPVQLIAHDLDDLPGISIAGVAMRDVMASTVNNGTQSMGMLTLDPSLAAQAASVGITTAKNLISKKAKQVKVHVKAGHQLLLHNKNK